MPDFKEPDWKELRALFVKQQSAHYRFVTRALLGFGLFTTLLFGIVIFGKIPPLKWESVSLLCIAIATITLPLLSRFNISKDGGSFDLADPMDLFDRLETSDQKAEAARSESFEQTRTQISALSLQISELSSLIQRLAPIEISQEMPAEKSEESIPALEIASAAEPNLRAVRKLLPKPTMEDDPQKNRFGGSASNKNRILSAEVSKSDVGRRWYSITFKLSSTDNQPLSGIYAYFFLHDTFDPDVYRVKIPPGAYSVTFETTAIGAFTAGVVADRGTTMLELDLASKEVSAPQSFKEN